MSTTTRDETTVNAWTEDAQFFEYSKAANPIGEGLTTKVPMADFPRHLHESGPTRIIPFDLSQELKCPGPATSPALCSNFIRILQGEHIRTTPNATSELYYVIRGKGRTRVHGEDIRWSKGDFLTLPAGSEAEHFADDDAAFYWVHDEPLLRYLGAARPRRGLNRRSTPARGRSWNWRRSKMTPTRRRRAGSAYSWPTRNSLRPGRSPT